MALSYSSSLTRKGQATIPAELRAKLGLEEGDRLVWWEDDGQLCVMNAQRYAERMSSRFEAQRDPGQPSLTIEEVRAAREETWTYRHDRTVVDR